MIPTTFHDEMEHQMIKVESPDMNRSVQMTDMIKSKTITPQDVCELRQIIFKDGITSPKHAATLIALEKVCQNTCGEWSDYYVTSLVDFILCRCEPHGGISDDNTDWLKRVLTDKGLVRSSNEFQLLKSLLERAVPAAPSFCALVLQQLHHAMLDFPEPKPVIDHDEKMPSSSYHYADSMDVLDRLSAAVTFK